MERWTDKQIKKKRDEQISRWNDGQRDRKERWTDKQTEKWTD